ncbi:MAG: aminotransferase class I/II-fold pyridoxal phosphate-dependent enzyme [Clostridiaceae bacterium]|nr:aminotransferase class I/II-fold pyridoxal phosphate-dependent enzyme [Eubacteriales bacterium]
MNRIASMDRAQLKALYAEELQKYEQIKAKGLKLDMSRGKPGSDQLDLSDGLLSLPVSGETTADGMDVRNYGVLDGLPSCRRLFADILGVDVKEVFAAGNASLNLMYDVIAKAYTHGLVNSEKPWSRLERVKFLCPAPGYDRHFKISETFGMEMLTVPMTEHGPDMDLVERLVKDPDVKGIWCVPKFSNPEGIVYSDETILRLARLKPAAPDFIIMWDNAYCVHEFDGEYVEIREILSTCREAGSPDMVFEFASTSKVTYPGAGVSCFACSERSMAHMKKLIAAQSISYDKVNQLRHVLFLKDKANVLAHMKKHAAILKPKFDAVISRLDAEIAPLGIASYNRPKGGYFVSLDTLPGCAKRTHALLKELGVVMTGAGATFPYGVDPEDKNLRIAPSYPPTAELNAAMEALCVCLKLAACEKVLG